MPHFTRTILFSLLFLFGLFTNAYALLFPIPPANQYFYIDQANLIERNIGNQINQIANKLWQDKKIPLFVVTIPSLITEGAIHYSVGDYASALFNHWGVGSKDKSYGILLLISKADRNVSIEFGSGFGTRYEVEKLNIIRQMMTPDFDKNQFENGILKGVMLLNAFAVGLDLPQQTQRLNFISNANSSLHFTFSWLFKYILLCSIVIYIFSRFKNNPRHQAILINRRKVSKRRENK